jgi:periplasmic nitrate reductase NapD
MQKYANSKSAALSRRAVLTGRVATELHISSMIVQTRPEHLARVSAEIAALPGVEIHDTAPAGKIVVLLETASESEIADRLTSIHGFDGVITATLVYHQVDAEEDARDDT